MTNQIIDLDLDIIVPEPKKVLLNGKVVTCNIPTMAQLIAVAKMKDSVDKSDDVDSLMEDMKKVLIPIIPEIADDDNFNLKVVQFTNIFNFIEKISTEERKLPDDVSSPKKKTA
jgi:hypothetical protein